MLASLILLQTIACNPKPVNITAPQWSLSTQDIPLETPIQSPSSYFDDLYLGNKLALDSLGNTYLGGITQGSSVPDVDAEPAVGQVSFSLAKYDTTGQLSWTKPVINTSIEYLPPKVNSVHSRFWYYLTRDISVRLDNNGDIYVLTPFVADSTIADAHWYLAKYDAQGALLWEHYASSPLHEIEVPITLLIGDNNQIFVHAANVLSTSIESVIIALDSNGNQQWEHRGPNISHFVDANNAIVLSEYKNFLDVRISQINTDLYISYFDINLDITNSLLNVTPILQQLDATGQQVWELRDPTLALDYTRIMTDERVFYNNVAANSLSVIGGDALGNILVKRGNLEYGRQVQKIANDGTQLWKFNSQTPFKPITDELGNLYTLEIIDPFSEIHYDPIRVTTFTHVDPNGQNVISKKISLGTSITSENLFLLSEVVGFHRDSANRFYIDSKIVNCTWRCFTSDNAYANSAWEEIIVLDASGTALTVFQTPRHDVTTPYYGFDEVGNLLIANRYRFSEYDINALTSSIP